MTEAEELEMKRLCAVLGQIAEMNMGPTEIEALKKTAATAPAPLADFDKTISESQAKLTALNASRAAIPHLAASASARIVNIGAIGALQAGAGMGAYAASKAGVHRLTEALAAEWKGKITVNAVLPSIIDTAANRASMPKADFAKWVTPQELAEVILFLVSDAASAVTGALLPVSGRV